MEFDNLPSGIADAPFDVASIDAINRASGVTVDRLWRSITSLDSTETGTGSVRGTETTTKVARVDTVGRTSRPTFKRLRLRLRVAAFDTSEASASSISGAESATKATGVYAVRRTRLPTL